MDTIKTMPCIFKTNADETTEIIHTTEPLISSAYICCGLEDKPSMSVLKQRIIDLFQYTKDDYTMLEIFAKVYKGKESKYGFDNVKSIILLLVDQDVIMRQDGENATKYTLSEIRESAIEEIKSRGQIAEEYKVWIPRRWR